MGLRLAGLNLCRNTGHDDDDPDGPGEPLANSNRDLCLVFTSFVRSTRSGDLLVTSYLNIRRHLLVQHCFQVRLPLLQVPRFTSGITIPILHALCRNQRMFANFRVRKKFEFLERVSARSLNVYENQSFEFIEDLRYQQYYIYLYDYTNEICPQRRLYF